MPHIHTGKGQHDAVVSMYIVRTDFDQPKVMLHVHKKHKKWMQFGGHVELDETPWQAVIHELREESGYGMRQLELLQPKDRMKALTGSELHPQPINVNTHQIGEDHYHTALEFAFITKEAPEFLPDDGESDQIKLFTRDELIAIPAGEIYEANRETLLYILDQLLVSWERIPADQYKII